MRKGRIRKIGAVYLLSLAFLLSACGARNSSASEEVYMKAEEPRSSAAGSYAMEAAYEDSFDESEDSEMYTANAESMTADGIEAGDPAATVKDESGAGQEDLKSSNRKIIYTGNISLQTLEYDSSSQSIHSKISQYGGFIENEDTYNDDPYWYYAERTGAAAKRARRNLNITARIPAEQFDAFMKDLENDGQVTNTSINARNVSVTYATREASKKALEIEQSRLLEMMEKAETVEEMIAVEQRLTEVERELNSEKTELSAIDRDVNFSTIYISLQEVFEYTEQVVEVTYGERLKRAFGRAIDGFVTFWQDLILFVVEFFPFLIMLAAVLYLLIRLHRRRRRRKMEEMIKLEEMRKNAAQQAGMTGYPGAYGPHTGFETGEGKAKRGGFFHRRKKEPEIPGNVNGPDTGRPETPEGAVQAADHEPVNHEPVNHEPAE